MFVLLVRGEKTSMGRGLRWSRAIGAVRVLVRLELGCVMAFECHGQGLVI